MSKAAKQPAKKSTRARAPRPAKVASLSAQTSQAAATTWPRTWFGRRADTVRPPTRRLPSVIQLSRGAALTLWDHRRLFIGITVIYGLLNILLVQGLAGHSDVSALKAEFDKVFQGNIGAVASSLTVFISLVGSSGNGTSSTAGAYQGILVIIASLAVIWALRQVLAGSQPRIRDAFYKGMHPLVPFILVLLIIGVQLLPLLIGSAIYNQVISNGIAVAAIEKIIWAVLFICLALTSLYMVSASALALYIVTLPDMTPIKALRSARDLVRYRRWSVLRKLLFLPLLMLVVAAVVMLPIIIWLTPLAQWLFFVLTMAALPAVHAYGYTLYRELLHE